MCSKKISDTDRKGIHSVFWNLTDNEKNTFYSKFVKKSAVKRRRLKGSERKQNTFLYYLETGDEMLQVCRIFFLNTLCIDIKMVYYYFKHLHEKTT